MARTKIVVRTVFPYPSSYVTISTPRREKWMFQYKGVELTDGRGIAVERVMREDHAVTPWVLIADSMALKAHPRYRDIDPEKRRGLYALRDFAVGDIIGRYVGRLLSKEEVEGARSHVDDVYFLTVDDVVIDGERPFQSKGRQLHMVNKELFDSETEMWPGACVHMANSNEGIPNARQNVKIDPSGYMRATAPIKKFTELLWPYAPDYEYFK